MTMFVATFRVLTRSRGWKLYSRMSTVTGEFIKEKTGLVLGVYTTDDDAERFKLTSAAQKLNEKTSGALLEHIKLAGAGVKKGKGQVFYKLGSQFPVIAVVGLGKEGAGYNEEEDIDEGQENVRIGAAVGCKKLQEVGVTKILLEGMGKPEAAAEGATLGLWLYQVFKNKIKQKKAPQLEFYGEENLEERAAWEKGVIKAQAQNVARNLADTPANRMTPTIFAQSTSELLTAHGVKVTVRDKSWAESKQMGSFLSVARGSAEPPVFLELHYSGAPKQEKPIALVGKGVTFDSGGISLKPSANMDEMRGDMGGAACVVATLYAAAALKLNVNLIGLIPLTENLPSGSATKPGDVVYAMNGKSIIVDNTDAEGRLILADALCYAQEFDTQLTVDIATLTGAIRIALGGAAAGVFSNSTHFFKKLRQAGALSGDRVWRLPLWEYYSKKVTDSASSDLVNIARGSSTGGGSCTAAAFLKEFVPKGDWMHVDIAGIMGTSENLPYLSKGMTGRPTRTLVEFISSLSKSGAGTS
ncbi:Cytosol aminopeptidase [Cryptotermes secundus]|uniref:Cytosol aminopeptidase n=1 Tax=Cryptotermes secundus TaxID=105785 RepID=A0A2J7PNA2_9NEOP|nr:cytosol aminopeptidase isoform X2 [Cryptotermes secundus]PNF17805.1 Cytosol aminopeptidase [Cryptotermes secundus]